MVAFSWLHLTDLHQGMGDQSWLLEEVLRDLHRDLEELHDVSGPWDLVLFTGDLTQRGSAEEFRALDATLTDLREKLARLGSRPVLLAVPGNHDLARPGERALSDPVVRNLVRWVDSRDVHEVFWNEPDSPYRRYVQGSFGAYLDWWGRHDHGFGRTGELRHGLLPGDFSTVIEKDGERLGIVGLNTAFLQLANGVKEGDLALHTRQYRAVCDKGWIDTCDAALLLTHHPPQWLDKESREDHLFGNIAVPGRFAVHLFGHMHEANGSTTSVPGGEARRFWQGTSLFGLEKWGDGRAVERAHGYSAGRISLDGAGATLRFWPRRAQRTLQKVWTVAPDYSFGTLERDQGTRPEPIRRLRPRRSAPPPATATPLPTSQWIPRAPGAPYHPSFYVARPREERQAINSITTDGQATVVWGPSLYGKSMFVHHVLGLLPAETRGKQVRSVHVDLAAFEAARDEAGFLHQLGMHILHAVDKDADLAPWPSGRSRIGFDDLLRDRILPRDGSIFVLFLESLQHLVGEPFGDRVLDLFRSFLQRTAEPWPALRLVVATSSRPAMRSAKSTSPFFNAATLILLGELTLDQSRHLAALYRLEWSDDLVAAARSLVGGHPFLLSLMMHEAKLDQTKPGDFFKPSSDAGRRLRERVRNMLPELDERALKGVRDLLHDRSTPIADDVYLPLRAAGVLERDGDACRFLGKIFEEILEERCE